MDRASTSFASPGEKTCAPVHITTRAIRRGGGAKVISKDRDGASDAAMAVLR